MRTTRTKIFAVTALGLSVGAPLVALAQSLNQTQNSTIASLVNLIIYYLNEALVLLMALSVVIFVWYVIKYFVLPNEKRSEGANYIMYSLIGFFVILSFWGLVNILQNTFGLNNTTNRPQSWASFSNLFPSGSGSSNPLQGTSGANGI